MEGGAVEADLDGGAVPRAGAWEGLRRRGRRRQGDGARGAQEAPGRQLAERGVHERVPLRHSVEQAAAASSSLVVGRRGRGADTERGHVTERLAHASVTNTSAQPGSAQVKDYEARDLLGRRPTTDCIVLGPVTLIVSQFP